MCRSHPHAACHAPLTLRVGCWSDGWEHQVQKSSRGHIGEGLGRREAGRRGHCVSMRGREAHVSHMMCVQNAISSSYMERSDTQIVLQTGKIVSVCHLSQLTRTLAHTPSLICSQFTYRFTSFFYSPSNSSFLPHLEIVDGECHACKPHRQTAGSQDGAARGGDAGRDHRDARKRHKALRDAFIPHT